MSGYCNGTIKNSYNTGAVTGLFSVGGVVGQNINTVTNCFFLSGTAADGIGGGNLSGAVSKTSGEFSGGAVAYLLQGGQSTPSWGHTSLDSGEFPQLLALTPEAAQVALVSFNEEPAIYLLTGQPMPFPSVTPPAGYHAVWQDADGTVYTESTLVSGDVMLTVSFEINTYTVMFYGNGGTLSDGDDEQTVEYGGAAAAPTYERGGYAFAGWDKTFDNVTSDLTITAQWTAVEYVITYILNGGTNHSSNPNKYTIESEAITLSSPTKTGYTFKSWTEGDTIPAGSTGDKTFTAEWTVIEYDIIYILNGGTNNSSNPNKYTIESEAITILLPTKTGYTFKCWTEGDTIPAGSTGNKTFTAQWEKTIYYVVLYSESVDSAYKTLTYDVESGGLTLPSPERKDYVFKGWYVSFDYTGEPLTVITADAMQDFALYAKWESVPKAGLFGCKAEIPDFLTALNVCGLTLFAAVFIIKFKNSSKTKP